MSMKKGLTEPTKKAEVVRVWHLVDVGDKILGRVATDIAQKLMGKGKPTFARNIDSGDFVVVVNAKKVKVTGRKETEKQYTQYSGYPGGMKKLPLWKLRESKPREIIRHAVVGMIPKNKLRARVMTRLYVYPGVDHPYKTRFPEVKVEEKK